MNRLLIALAETYDVLVTVPRSGRFELRASAQDGSGHASLYLGGGEVLFWGRAPGGDSEAFSNQLQKNGV